MKRIGIFQAKTHLSELCKEVEEKQAPYVIEKRGKPVALLSPVPPELDGKQPDILKSLDQWEKKHGREKGKSDFPEVWKERGQPKKAPLLD